MKKRALALFMLVASLALMLCGCGGKPTVATRAPRETFVTAETVDANLRYFLGIDDENGERVNHDGDMGNRGAASASERHAAEKLYNRYADISKYPHMNVTPLAQTEFTFTVSGTELASQNVEVRFKAENTDGKQVIISASYDNAYGAYDEEYAGSVSTGAFDSATAVATVMSLIDYCNDNAALLRPSLGFDIVFVFFGCGTYRSMGAEKYVADTMTADRRLNTLLMTDIGRLGGERMYLYADEVQTKHETFLRDAAAANGLQYYALPANMPLIDGEYIEGIHYAHFGMLGNRSVFAEWGIPTARIFSGCYGGFNLSDLEKKGQANIGATNKDTYETLLASRPAFAAQGSDTATLLLASMRSADFAATMQASRENTPDYSFWVNPFWAYIIVIAVIVALGITLIILVKHFEKKYPFKPIIKRMKIAVFGMEYETPTDEDVFVDVKRNRDPFDGY